MLVSPVPVRLQPVPSAEPIAVQTAAVVPLPAAHVVAARRSNAPCQLAYMDRWEEEPLASYVLKVLGSAFTGANTSMHDFEARAVSTMPRTCRYIAQVHRCIYSFGTPGYILKQARKIASYRKRG